MKALKKWFPLISLICGALALVMIFLPMGSLDFPALGINNKKYEGVKVCFGDKESHLEFSILNTLSFVLGLVGGVLAYLGAKSNNKIMKYVAIACFVVAFILICAAANLVQFDSNVPSAIAKEMRKEMKPAIGGILAAIFCVLGAASTACDTFIKDKE